MSTSVNLRVQRNIDFGLRAHNLANLPVSSPAEFGIPFAQTCPHTITGHYGDGYLQLLSRTIEQTFTSSKLRYTPWMAQAATKPGGSSDAPTT